MSDRPVFSIVSAVYDVAAYLPDYIASIEAQTYGLAAVEVVVVDDGSTDGSGDILRQWAARRPDLVTVLGKDNGGQSSARNLGLRHARGEWVTFTDPDDMLEPDALREVASFVDAHPSVALVGINRELWFDADDRRGDHPLRAHFEGGNRLRDLAAEPNYFFGSAPAAFFRTAEIERQGLTFRDDIRPSFEDGYFCCEYLLASPAALVGFVSTAGYVYRKRSDESSSLNRGDGDVRRYTSLLRLGYLGILDESVRRLGAVPGWLQTYILYELSFQFGREERINLPAAAAIAAEVHETLRRIADHLDHESIYGFSLRRFPNEWRDLLAHGLGHEDWTTPYAVVDRIDRDRRLQRVTYRYTGRRPDETLLVDGEKTAPAFAKIAARPYFHEIFVRRRIAWVPLGRVEIVLDGRSVETLSKEPAPRPAIARAARPAGRARLHERVLGRLARSGPVRRRFADSLVFTDGTEPLFRTVRDGHAETDAWFVADSAERSWLRRGGLPRVVTPDGVVGRLVLPNCRHLITSDVAAPGRLRGRMSGKPRWRVTLVPDRVTTADPPSSRIDVLAIATPAQYRSVTGDDTPSDYTEREATLTGLPRFDLLHAAGVATASERHDLVVVMVSEPWRGWLADSLTAAVGGARVEVVDRSEPDVLARARVVVTDDHATAFDAAYLARPVVYFLPGDAPGTSGWFDVERDGVGPVTTTPDAAVAETVAALAAGPAPRAPYRARGDALFPDRDGRGCERIVAAIRDSVRPVDA